MPRLRSSPSPSLTLQRQLDQASASPPFRPSLAGRRRSSTSTSSSAPSVGSFEGEPGTAGWTTTAIPLFKPGLGSSPPMGVEGGKGAIGMDQCIIREEEEGEDRRAPKSEEELLVTLGSGKTSSPVVNIKAKSPPKATSQVKHPSTADKILAFLSALRPHPPIRGPIALPPQRETLIDPTVWASRGEDSEAMAWLSSTTSSNRSGLGSKVAERRMDGENLEGGEIPDLVFTPLSSTESAALTDTAPFLSSSTLPTPPISSSQTHFQTLRHTSHLHFSSTRLRRSSSSPHSRKRRHLPLTPPMASPRELSLAHLRERRRVRFAIEGEAGMVRVGSEYLGREEEVPVTAQGGREVEGEEETWSDVSVSSFPDDDGPRGIRDRRLPLLDTSRQSAPLHFAAQYHPDENPWNCAPLLLTHPTASVAPGGQKILRRQSSLSRPAAASSGGERGALDISFGAKIILSPPPPPRLSLIPLPCAHQRN